MLYAHINILFSDESYPEYSRVPGLIAPLSWAQRISTYSHTDISHRRSIVKNVEDVSSCDLVEMCPNVYVGVLMNPPWIYYNKENPNAHTIDIQTFVR